MFKKNKNSTKGFTLMEIITALGIIVILGGLSITTLSSISQARMRDFAQTVKSEFETTRNLAKTHGGDAEFSLTKTENGAVITRTGANLTKEEKSLKDHNLAIFYYKTGDATPYELGVSDAPDVVDGTLTMTFSQTQGEIIGPHKLDSIVLSNGSKNYTLVIKQKTGMMYYDYELEEYNIDENVLNENVIMVSIPTFVYKGEFRDTLPPFKKTGSTIQPELNYDARYVRISGVYRADVTGKHEIVFSLKDPWATDWADGSDADKTLSWEIIP